MKIFEYNLQTKTRGTEVLAERSVCSGHGAAKVEFINGAEWYFLENPDAQDRAGNPINAAQYGKEAICFCIGQMTAGTDTVWSWVVTK